MGNNHEHGHDHSHSHGHKSDNNGLMVKILGLVLFAAAFIFKSSRQKSGFF